VGWTQLQEESRYSLAEQGETQRPPAMEPSTLGRKQRLSKLEEQLVHSSEEVPKQVAQEGLQVWQLSHWGRGSGQVTWPSCEVEITLSVLGQ